MPSIDMPMRVLQIAKDVMPDAPRIMGGVHATFMYKQVFTEAPWIDVIARDEGEEILVERMKIVDERRWPTDRLKINGLAFVEGAQIVATQPASTVKDLTGIDPEWLLLEWEKYIYMPLNKRVAIPNLAREGSGRDIRLFKIRLCPPIMKPEAPTRGELLDGVIKNYLRFYMRRALFQYPWHGTGYRRRYLLGCLKAFLKARISRTFYDPGKAGYWGLQTKNSVHFDFDETRTIAKAQMEDWEASADRAARAAEHSETLRKQGKERAVERSHACKMSNGAAVKACGGGSAQLDELDA